MPVQGGAVRIASGTPWPLGGACPCTSVPRRGTFENILSAKLDGSEDHLGRGDDPRFWLELDMPSKRAQALAQIQDQLVTGALRWENRGDVLEPFHARGQLDEYLAGQGTRGRSSTVVLGATAKSRLPMKM